MLRSRGLLIVVAALAPAASAEAAEPNWVTSYGKSAPCSGCLVGFGVSTEGDLDKAKLEAAASLARGISLRIRQSVRDVSVEKNGQHAYEVSSVTAATTDIELPHLEYRVHRARGRAYALAELNRDAASQRRRAERDAMLNTATTCLRHGRKAQSRGQAALAFKTLLGCRTSAQRGLEYGAQILAIMGRESPADQAAGRELLDVTFEIDSAVESTSSTPARTIEELAELIALRIGSQGVVGKGGWSVSPFTLGSTPFSSAFGRRLASAVERSLIVRAATGQRGKDPLVVVGTYHDTSKEVSVSFAVRRPGGGALLAAGRVVGQRGTIAKVASLRPQNIGAAIEDFDVLDAAASDSAPTLRLWTTRGDRNLVFEEGDEFGLYLKLSRPGYVRLIYIMADGTRVLLEKGMYIGPKQTHGKVTYPSTFAVSPPFGAEQLYAVAFADRPADLKVTTRDIDGERYDTVERPEMVKHRGAGERSRPFAEAVLSITTIARRR